MKIAITGSTGHVGVNLVKQLVKHGHEVKALVYSGSGALSDVDIIKISGSLHDIDSLNNLCEDADVVFHLAALISIGSESKELVNRTNVEGTKNVLNAARKAGVKKFIHFSSIHALIHYPLNEPMDEKRGIAINSPIIYEQTKAIAEDWVLSQNSNDFEVVVLNPTSIIGPEDTKPSLMGGLMVKVYNNSIPGVIPGGYDWVDVRDIVDAAIAAITNGRGGERYILSGKWLTIKSFTDLFVDVSDRNKYLPVLPLWLAKIGVPFMFVYSKIMKTEPIYTYESITILQCGNRVISSKKALKELGFKPRPLEDTLTDIYNWFKENKYI